MKTINCLLFAFLLSAFAFGQEDTDFDMLPPADADAPDSEIQTIEAPPEPVKVEAPPPPPIPMPPKDVPPPIPPPPPISDTQAIEISSDTESGYIENYYKSDEAQPEIFQVVEDMPEFPGGEKEMLDFLYKNIKYPANARKEGIQGIVVISFVVTPSGNYTNVKSIREPNSSLGEEAMRVIKLMPKWNPGKQRGQAVPVKYNLPIRFKL